MKRYFGSGLTLYAAIIFPCFILGALLFAGSMLFPFTTTSIFVFFLCICCAVVWGAYLKQIFIQLYTWGEFNETGIQSRSFFSQINVIPYSKCKSIGIGFYIHGFLNTSVGTKKFFIFFSCEKFDEHYRTRMNFWKPSCSRVKVKFDSKLYEYLLNVLSPSQRRVLQNDYEKYVKNR